ncbi:MAG: hypothetical protein R3E54_05175 [Halioglobus sp.]
MALLTGFLFGSLAVVWPWKRVLQWVPGSHGEPRAAQLLPVSPADYVVYSGQNAQLGLCVTLMLVGFALVWFIHARWGDA